MILGFSGASGFSGFSGFSRVSGFSGFSGVSGNSGFSGSKKITYLITNFSNKLSLFSALLSLLLAAL